MVILRRIEKFLRDTDMPPTRFGRDAVRDPRFVSDLRNGREPSRRMIERVEHFMSLFHSGAIMQ